MLNSKNFYDEISGFYGKMIDLEKNLALRTSAYKNIFPQPGRTADIGCGIGLDSIALARNGHSVSSFDPSPLMIAEAKNNASKFNVSIDSHVHSFNSLPNKYSGFFDNIVSVGNTIAHLSPVDLKKAFKKIKQALVPGGKLFVHILNYELILSEKKRINNIAVRDGQTIIRFYDLGNKKIRFNILSFPSATPREFRLVTTIHYPHSKKTIVNLLKDAGFYKIKLSGNFAGDSFDPGKSKDLFIEAIRK